MINPEEALAAAALVRRGFAKFREEPDGLRVELSDKLLAYAKKHDIKSSSALLKIILEKEAKKKAEGKS